MVVLFRTILGGHKVARNELVYALSLLLNHTLENFELVQ